MAFTGRQHSHYSFIMTSEVTNYLQGWCYHSFKSRLVCFPLNISSYQKKLSMKQWRWSLKPMAPVIKHWNQTFATVIKHWKKALWLFTTVNFKANENIIWYVFASAAFLNKYGQLQNSKNAQHKKNAFSLKKKRISANKIPKHVKAHLPNNRCFKNTTCLVRLFAVK